MSEKVKRIFLSCLVVDNIERVFVIYLTRAVAIRMRVCGKCACVISFFRYISKEPVYVASRIFATYTLRTYVYIDLYIHIFDIYIYL